MTPGRPQAAEPPHPLGIALIALLVPTSPFRRSRRSASRSFHTRRGSQHCCRRPGPTAYLPPTRMRKVDFAFTAGIQVFRRERFFASGPFLERRAPVRPVPLRRSPGPWTIRVFESSIEPEGGRRWKTLHRPFCNPPRTHGGCGRPRRQGEGFGSVAAPRRRETFPFNVVEP